MATMAWKKIMTILTVIDVLIAAILMTAYVTLLADHLPELQMIKGSKSYHLIVYIYVSACTVIQILVAFKFYQTLTIPKSGNEDVEMEDLLPITKYWIIASYILLFNWALKAGIYAQKCNCGISVALAVYLTEITFRVCAICIGSTFLKKLEKAIDEKKVQIRLHSVLPSLKAKKVDSSLHILDEKHYSLNQVMTN